MPQGRKKRVYIGESSKSGFQRVRKHRKELRDGAFIHAMVIHCLKEHDGEIQEVMFKIVSKYQTPLERQVRESMVIVKSCKEVS